jgi:YD repeat-containing protein
MLMLDTHIAVAFAEGKTRGLSKRALQLFDVQPTFISPAVVLELELLFEIGRLKSNSDTLVSYLQNELMISVAGDKFSDVARQARHYRFTRDPFDRLITAHAAWARAKLITLDQHILANFADAME